MKELEQLVRYANPTRLRRLAFYKNRSSGAESQLKKLYQAISDGKVTNDEEASKLLFSKKGDPRYTKLKYLLKEQLINTAILIDKGNRTSDPYDYHYIDTRRKLFAAEVLRRSAAYHGAFSLAKKALDHAEKAGLSDIACRCCDILVSYYSFARRIPAKRKKYLEKAAYWHSMHRADYEARLVYEHYMGYFLDNTSFPGDLSIQLGESIEELDSQFPTVDSVDFNYYAGFLKVILAMNTANYHEVILICNKQIGLLTSKEVYPKTYERNFLLQIISVSISIEDFDSGVSAIRRLNELASDGSRPWFRTQQLYIQLAITSNKYDLAVRLVGEVTSHKSFKNLAEAVRERIILLKAYVYWLGARRKVEDSGENFSSFRLAKFLNSVPEFEKDRQGLHIPVLIAQALWLLHRKQFEKVRSRLVALRRYADRYLKNAKGTVRAYYFLRAFCKLADADFQRNGFIRRSEKNRVLLDQHPRSKVEQNVEMEIIPYERLYELVVEQLDLKLH